MSTMTRLLAAGSTAMFLLIGAVPAADAANLVTNGDFEVFVPSNATGGGWTSSNISGGGHQATGGNPDGNFILNDVAGPMPTLVQTVGGLNVGESYIVSGDFASFAASFGDPAVESFDVAIDGVILFASVKGAEGVWSSFAEQFIAAAASVELRIRGQVGTDASYRVDNIAIEGGRNGGGGEIPTPAALPMGLTLLALAAGRRSRR